MAQAALPALFHPHRVRSPAAPLDQPLFSACTPGCWGLHEGISAEGASLEVNSPCLHPHCPASLFSSSQSAQTMPLLLTGFREMEIDTLRRGWREM